jgi:FlaA1/EpsC-like NDP-sugar epimerase
MIKLSGFDENKIKITFTGLRPCEKLYKESLADDEYSLTTCYPKLRVAKAPQIVNKVLPKIIT